MYSVITFKGDIDFKVALQHCNNSCPPSLRSIFLFGQLIFITFCHWDIGKSFKGHIVIKCYCSVLLCGRVSVFILQNFHSHTDARTYITKRQNNDPLILIAMVALSGIIKLKIYTFLKFRCFLEFQFLLPSFYALFSSCEILFIFSKVSNKNKNYKC